jgi:Na+/proline symporter
MILSLFWPRLTARGALAAMLSGFAAVPFFKFVAPQLPWVGSSFSALSELPPAFVVSGCVAIGVSLLDRHGKHITTEVRQELLQAGNRSNTSSRS